MRAGGLTTMRAIVYERYGSPDVLELREVAQPEIGESDVRVRVHAAGVSAGDGHLLTGAMWAVRLYQGVLSPKRRILGYDVSGTVEAVGAKVTRFRPGDEVFGAGPGAGAFAEVMRVPEDGLARKPAGLSHADAAAVPTSAVTALQGLRDKGRIRAGQQVLVHGASGGVGSFAVQIAKADGAEVTGTCSAAKVDFVRSLGADHVLDYRAPDFTLGEGRWDLILDLAGRHPVAECRRALTPDGIYVVAAGAVTRTLRIALFGGKRMVGYIAQTRAKDLETITELVEAGKLSPRVERCFPLGETADALRLLLEGRVRGKLVVAVRGG